MKELNHLENDLVQEAMNPKKKDKWNSSWVKVAAVAACVTLFVGGIGGAVLRTKLQDSTGTISHVTMSAPGEGTQPESSGTDAVWFESERMVMVDGVLYKDIGGWVDRLSHEANNFDGKITSSTEPGEIPTEDNQSNFGIKYENQQYMYQKQNEHVLVVVPEGGMTEQIFTSDIVFMKELKGSVTSEGMSLLISYYGKPTEDMVIETGTYTLHKVNENGTTVECALIGEKNQQNKKYILKNNDIYVMSVDWNRQYGALEPGEYCLIQDVKVGERSVQLKESFVIDEKQDDNPDIIGEWSPEDVGFPLLEDGLRYTENPSERTNYASMYVVENTITNTGATFQFNYQYASDGFTDGNFAVYKRYADGTVRECDSSEGVIWELIPVNLEKGDANTFEVNWEPSYGTLEDGSYVLVKQYYVNDVRKYAIASFVIGDNAVKVEEEETTSFYDEYKGALEVNLDMEVFADTVTSTGLKACINYSGSGEAICGEEYSIEYKSEDGTWKQCPIFAEVAIIDIAWVIESEKPREFSVNWADVYGELDSGEYHLVKTVHAEGQSFELTAPFIIP